MFIKIDFRMQNASGIGKYIKNIVPFLIDRFDIILLGNIDEIQKYRWSNKVEIVECNSKIYSLVFFFAFPFFNVLFIWVFFGLILSC